MTKYNEELFETGVRVMAKGLHPSSNGMRISFPNPGEEPVLSPLKFVSIAYPSRRWSCAVHKAEG